MSVPISAAGLPQRRLQWVDFGGAVSKAAEAGSKVAAVNGERAMGRAGLQAEVASGRGTPGAVPVADGIRSVDWSKDYVGEPIKFQPAVRGEPADTLVSYKVNVGDKFPDTYEVVEAASLVVDAKLILTLNTKDGTVSGQGKMFGAGFPDEMKTFNKVEWGVGESRVQELVGTLQLIRASNELCLLCSVSGLLAEAFVLLKPTASSRPAEEHSLAAAQNGRGRRALMQGALGCGTFRSESFCMTGIPPVRFSAGESAALRIYKFTPIITLGSKMVMCASLGVMQSVTVDASRTAAPIPGPAATNTKESTIIIAVVGGALALGFCIIALKLIRMRVNNQTLMRQSGQTAVTSAA